MVYSAGAIKVVLEKFLFHYLVVNGGKINNTNERDHLYAKSSINVNNWKFLYQNVSENNKQKIALLKLLIFVFMMI